MAQFVPRAGSPTLNPFQILGAVYTFAHTDAHRIRYTIEGESALSSDIQWSNSLNRNFVYIELGRRDTSLAHMTLEAWVHEDDMHKFSSCCPNVQLSGEG